jgi:hypothetical protein
MDLFEAVYQLSQAPTWLGWSLLAGGTHALVWMHGAGRYDKEHADD